MRFLRPILVALALLPITGSAAIFTQILGSQPAADSTPNAFSFTDQSNVALSSTITSSTVTLTGTEVAVTCNATSGTIDKNGANFLSSQSMATGDTMRARHTSSASNSTAVNTVVNCNGVSDTFTSTTLASGGGDVDADIFNDSFEDRPTGNVTLTTAWSSRGYTDVVRDSLVEITARAGAPAALLADARVPAGKTRFLHLRHAANEANNRIVWEDFPSGIREAYFSWWEYRPNANLGGEKFLRMGNRLANGNRGHDVILGLSDYISDGSLVEGFGFFDNSENSFDFTESMVSRTSQDWPDTVGLAHFEVRWLMSSTATSTDGVLQLWIDGVLHVNHTGVRNNIDAAGALRNMELVELFGGWSSTGSAEPGSYTYPIDRWFLGGKISTTRLGVWPVDMD